MTVRAGGASTAVGELQQLRLEHSLLSTERTFLLHELDTCPEVAERVTTARYSATATECQLLQLYLTAVQGKDSEGCQAVEQQMRRRVREMQQKAAQLERMLRSIQDDVRHMMSQRVLQYSS